MYLEKDLHTLIMEQFAFLDFAPCMCLLDKIEKMLNDKEVDHFQLSGLL